MTTTDTAATVRALGLDITGRTVQLITGRTVRVDSAVAEIL